MANSDTGAPGPAGGDGSDEGERLDPAALDYRRRGDEGAHLKFYRSSIARFNARGVSAIGDVAEARGLVSRTPPGMIIVVKRKSREILCIPTDEAEGRFDLVWSADLRVARIDMLGIYRKYNLRLPKGRTQTLNITPRNDPTYKECLVLPLRSASDKPSTTTVKKAAKTQNPTELED